MSDSLHHKKEFNASDIQRYWSGEMSAQERHAMERAALSDSLLSDALEGYETVQSNPEKTAANLADLRKQLQRKTAPAFNWKPLAAAAVVVIAVGVYFWNTNKDEKPTIAQQEQKSESPVTTDTIAVKPAIASSIDTSENNLTNAPQSTLAKVVPTKENSKQLDIKSEPLADRSINIPAPIAAPNNAVASSPQSSDDRFESKAFTITDSAGKLIKDAEVVITKTNESLKEENGKYYFNKSDSNKQIKITHPNFEDAVATLKPNQNSVVLQPKQPVVVGYATKAAGPSAIGSKKKEDNTPLVVGGFKTNVVFKNKTNAPKGLIQDAEPQDGWIAFNEYVLKNRKIITDNPEGKLSVVISFLVNKDGELSGFRIEQSLTEQFDQEAIRLIKEGPSWHLLKGKKARVIAIIPF